MIQLKPVSTENFWDVIYLQVRKDQEHLVLSNAVSIAQAYVQSECIPLAIYANQEMVGFVMYCLDRDDQEYWIYRLMIDQKYQGKGYGKLALQEVMRIIKTDSTHHLIFLGVDSTGIESVSLYISLGFVFTNEIYGKEHIMVYHY